MSRKHKYATLSSADVARILRDYLARRDPKMIGRVAELVAVTDEDGRLEIEVWIKPRGKGARRDDD